MCAPTGRVRRTVTRRVCWAHSVYPIYFVSKYSQMLENRSIYRSLGKKSIKTNKEGAPFL